MPAWWTRTKNSQRVQRDHKQHNHGKKKEQEDKYRKKPKSFDESILFAHNYSRNSLDLKASSLSISGSSVFAGFDSDIGIEVAEKKAYPLPKPACSPEPSINFDKKLDSEVALHSSSSSSLSLSSSISSNDEGVDATVNDHGDFGSFRAVEETNYNSWLRTSCPGSKASTTQASPLPPVLLESPSEKQESRRHPCHPLPLPPGYPNKSSQNMQSNWKKGKLIGRGTFGLVYAGFNSENGQMCAIKEVRIISDDQNSTECLKQLNQEIALLSELSHPNIVRYYGSKMVEDKLSVYLQYVSGGSIQKLLNEYGPFAEPVIRSYTKQILSGLAYLHKRNTVHRDIKGANILVDPNGEIKLVDFGMAKHTKSGSSMLSFKGSPYWMAPEVIMNTSSYNLAVDIWSLGCTILEMATSKPPWSQYEGVAAIFKIANSSENPELPNYLSEDAQNFVKLCLQRDPSARPTAVQLLNHPFIQNQDIGEVAIANSNGEAFSAYGRHPTG
ncbi:mitogen-activated protein kinase kinase kinase 3 [Hevea brasiliensis]|uniref:mitogen-activated protein kinase kinase kinase 3 n=1 Tax=Hevea brasiliensis TaxID=3981 RepID=UPI0025EF125E|nr:mitogen-activated protein kinase kinase kinase 3 [Hevea brasiliensis]